MRKKETLSLSENTVPPPQPDYFLSQYDLEYYCNILVKEGGCISVEHTNNLQPGVISWYWAFSNWQQNTLLDYVGTWDGQYDNSGIICFADQFEYFEII